LLRDVQCFVSCAQRFQSFRGKRRAGMLGLRKAKQNLGIEKNRHLFAARAVDGIPAECIIGNQWRSRRVALAPGGKRPRPLFRVEQMSPPALLYIGGELSHGFLRNLSPFAARQGSARLIDSCAKLDAPPLALFPQGKSLPHRVFLALQSPSFHSMAGERPLIGCKMHFHRFGSFTQTTANRNRKPLMGAMHR
jgi:hypothetical protein